MEKQVCGSRWVSILSYSGIVFNHKKECYTDTTDELEPLRLPVQLGGAPPMDFYLRKGKQSATR